MKNRLITASVCTVLTFMSSPTTQFGAEIKGYECYTGARASIGRPTSTQACSGDCVTIIYSRSVSECYPTGNESDVCIYNELYNPPVTVEYYSGQCGVDAPTSESGEHCLCPAPSNGQQPTTTATTSDGCI